MENKFVNKLSTLLLYSSILIFIIAFNFEHNPSNGWYQQFMPNLNNQPISDMTFLDSLTGFAVTNDNMSSHDTGYILKTTNGGDNWSIKFKDVRDFSKITFINSNTGFTCGGSGSGTSFLYKTTDAGENWFAINTGLGNLFFNDMSVLNEDTIWVVDKNDFSGGVYRTTNGGFNWILQYQPSGAQNPNKIYMFNARIGFISNSSALPNTKKTTNGGFNWFTVLEGEKFTDIYFVDSLVGWKCSSSDMGFIRKTTNGGLDWFIQPLPPEAPPFLFSRIVNLAVVNTDTIWGVGGTFGISPANFRGVIYKTTNGGTNWGYQIPDTSIHITGYAFIQFINRKIGWTLSLNQGGIHTTDGGDTVTYYTGVQNISSEIPSEFKLHQNYPNPFNPKTVIPYKIKKASYVRLIAYDILGKEVLQLVNQYQQAGEYEVDFTGKYESSGIYFYRIEVEDNNSGKIFSETKHMILLK